MPDPPAVNLLTRYVLENPWPLGLALLAIAASLGWIGMREGLTNRLRAAAAFGLAGAAILITGSMVVTSGEHAKAVTRALVGAAVKADVVGAFGMFSQDAALAFASPRNPGFGVDFIRDRFLPLANQYKIDSNSITMLRGYSESSDSATVHLACLTYVEAFPYPSASQWVARVQRQADGEWKVTHLTWVSLNGKPPPTNAMW